MAIKVQVKETGTSKVQPNLFNNGAAMGMGAYDFAGVQPTIGGEFNAWNTAVNGLNAMNDLSGIYATNTNLPYARQNTLEGQLPGMWQRESLVNPMAASMGFNPWTSSLNTVAPFTGSSFGMSPWTAGFNTAAPFTGSTVGMSPWTAGLNSMPTYAGMNTPFFGAGMTSPAMGTTGINAQGTPGSLMTRQAAISGQTPVAHLLVDILDDGTQYLLTADLPGVKIDDLELTVENGVLFIKAVSQDRAFVSGLGISTPVATIVREKAPVKVYQRSFVIGRDITVEDITASITNGVLTISLPKVNAMTATNSRIRNTVSACA
jgi:HSP20 family protein